MTPNKKATLKTYNKTFLKMLERGINDQMMFKNFFANFTIEEIDKKHHVSIGTTCSDSNLLMISKVFKNLINKALEDTFDSVCTFSFVSKLDENEKPKQTKTKVKKEIKTSTSTFGKGISPDMTFDNYVECYFNKQALKIAKYVVSGGKDYNPIFIFGKSGIGKTHLLYAISNEMISRTKKVKYIDANSFTREISYILQENDQVKIKEVRNEFNEADIVMFDDFQSYGFGNKRATLNLIFNILDDRINHKKIIVVCSDRPINSLKNMFEERLISRLSMGLQIELTEPRQQDLLKILNFMIKENKMSPSSWEKDAKHYIVQNHAANIRTMIGAINRLKFYNEDIKKTHSRYTLSIVNSILKDIQQSKETLVPDDIIEYVAKYYKVAKKDILGKSRKKDIVLARHISMWLIRSQIDISLEQIGTIFGNRDHSTVVNALNKIDEQVDRQEASLKMTLSQMSDELWRLK